MSQNQVRNQAWTRKKQRSNDREKKQELDQNPGKNNAENRQKQWRYKRETRQEQKRIKAGTREKPSYKIGLEPGYKPAKSSPLPPTYSTTGVGTAPLSPDPQASTSKQAAHSAKTQMNSSAVGPSMITRLKEHEAQKAADSTLLWWLKWLLMMVPHWSSGPGRYESLC